MATTQVNSATGLVGPTGAGKTSLIATGAEYLWETFQQILLLYTADGGGFPTKVQSLVRNGIIRVWRMRTRGEAFETTVRASEGWWPSKIDPNTGETEPHVRLVPPMTEKYVMHCPNGHVVKIVPFQSLLTPTLCPTCKVHTTRENMRVDKSVVRTAGFDKVGGVAFDGLTSFLSWQMTDMAGRHARQELKGEDTAIGGRVQSGDLVLGGNNRSHFGFVQLRAEDMVLKSSGIPGLSIPPIWTMLLMETVDEGGLPVKGPKLAGKAKTDEAPSWFGNMLEVGVVRNEEGKEVRRLSLNEYIDDAGARHLIKHRGGPTLPPYLQDGFDQPWSQVNLGVFFSLLAKEVDDSAVAAAAKYPNAPGVEAVSYGEVLVAAPAVAAATGPVASPQPAGPQVLRPGRPPAPRAKPAAPQPAPAAVTPSPASPELAPAVPVEEPVPAVPPAPVQEPVAEPLPAPEPEPAPALAQVAAPQARPLIGRPPGMAPPPGRRPAVAPRQPPARPQPVIPQS